MTDAEADAAQKWASMDGATAFLLIERHANNWQETGTMMEAWRRAAVAETVRRCAEIICQHQVPVGNSSAGEMACEWTMDALKELRDTIKAEFPEAFE